MLKNSKRIRRIISKGIMTCMGFYSKTIEAKENEIKSLNKYEDVIVQKLNYLHGKVD